MKQTDLTHIYRALKITEEILEHSPELATDNEHDVFLIAMQIVNDDLKGEYKDEDD